VGSPRPHGDIVDIDVIAVLAVAEEPDIDTLAVVARRQGDRVLLPAERIAGGIVALQWCLQIFPDRAICRHLDLDIVVIIGYSLSCDIQKSTTGAPVPTRFSGPVSILAEPVYE